MEKNDKKLLNLYYFIIVINIVLFAVAIYLCAFVFNFEKNSTRIFVSAFVLIALCAIFLLIDILIINYFSKKWKVE